MANEPPDAAHAGQLGHSAEWRRERRDYFWRSKWKIPSPGSKVFPPSTVYLGFPHPFGVIPVTAHLANMGHLFHVALSKDALYLGQGSVTKCVC